MPEAAHRRTRHFAEYTFDAVTGELHRHGRRVALRPQAALVLERLLRRPGELVTREELQETLWGDTAVDAEAGLNHCIRQVRRALGDSAAEPRFVATEPRRGYRFIATVGAGRSEHPEPLAGADRTAPGGNDGSDRGRPGILRRFPPRAIFLPSRIRLRRLAGPGRFGGRGALAAALAGLTGAVVLIAGTGLFRGAIGGGDRDTPLQRPTTVAEVPATVFPDYQRARYLLRQPGADPAGRAVALLERVARRAPEFAAGHAALARALLQADPASTGERAREHVERALQLAPTLPEALLVRGDIRSLIDGDWSAAEHDYRSARQAAPQLAEALHHLAGLLAVLGRHDEAIRLMHQALEIDPVSPLLAGDLAWFYFAARDWPSARHWARRTLELEPSWGAARSVLLHASARVGDIDEVRRQAAATLREGGADPGVIDGVAAAQDPLAPYWRWWDEQLADAQDPASRVHRAWTHAALGREQAALDDLEAAESAGYRFLPFLIADPRLDAVRTTARFEALLDRLGLPAATRSRAAPHGLS